RRLLRGERRIAEKYYRFLPLVVEYHVEHAVVIQIDQSDGLRIEDPLVQADFFGGVCKRAVTLVAEEAVRAAQATDHQVEVAVVIDVAPGGAGGRTCEL